MLSDLTRGFLGLDEGPKSEADHQFEQSRSESTLRRHYQETGSLPDDVDLELRERIMSDDSLFDSFRTQVLQKITKTERDRIHTEFATWIRSLPDPVTISHDRVINQLDRICPKE